jgi:hypothetical protein
MTDRDDPKIASSDSAEPVEELPPGVDLDAPDPMAALLRRSLTEPAHPGKPSPSILRGVQRRIRKRSRGRFFADGWSTADGRVNHLLIAAGMLIVLVVAYFALGPMGVQ